MADQFNIDLNKAIVQNVWTGHRDTNLDVLRLDLIHPVISGNKWFKLKYYLEEVATKKYKGIVTCGGAFSNHLVAVAASCEMNKLSSVGIVRGEEPRDYSPTLLQAKQSGMQLVFVSRKEYGNKTELEKWARKEYPDCMWINEGGQGESGVKGASEIANLLPFETYSHIICAVGTGTMMAGLLRVTNPSQQVIGIPVLKINDGKNNSIVEALKRYSNKSNYELLYEFYGKGYGKYTPSLLLFMNALYDKYHLPSDFVYTAKLFQATFELAAKDFFPKGSRLLAIHSGGLQGNRSIETGILKF